MSYMLRRAMLKRPAVATLGLLALLSAQDRPTFRASVTQIYVDAAVVTKEGRIITGLSQADFRVFDESKEQALVGFAAEEQPLDLILLFDISGSMRSIVQKVAESADQALLELRKGDRVAIMVFSDSTRLAEPFTKDLDAVASGIRDVLKLRFGGPTFLRDAVDDAANYFLREKRTTRRRAILVITDNVGVRSRREMPIVRNLWEADAILSGLITPHAQDRIMRRVAAVLAPGVVGIENFAEKTGGEAMRSGDPGSDFTAMMRRLRNRYSLYYDAPRGKPGATRSIRVQLGPETQKRFPGARVYARRGYRLGTTQDD